MQLEIFKNNEIIALVQLKEGYAFRISGSKTITPNNTTSENISKAVIESKNILNNVEDILNGKETTVNLDSLLTVAKLSPYAEYVPIAEKLLPMLSKGEISLNLVSTLYNKVKEYKDKKKEEKVKEIIEEANNIPSDIEEVKKLKYKGSGDNHNLAKACGGFVGQSKLPIDFEVTFTRNGIYPTKPESSPEELGSSDHGRRITAMMFNANDELVLTWDSATHIDDRVCTGIDERGAVKCLVLHSRDGQTLSRSKITYLK